MSESILKHKWLTNWRAARDKERTACVAGNFETARFWCRIALEIEAGFLAYFGQDFGSFLVENLG